MALFIGKILFHRKSNEQRFVEASQDEMLEELEAVLNKYGVELARYELASLPSQHYPADKCYRCGYLTLDVANSSQELEKGALYDDLNVVIHSGRIKNNQLICTECEEWLENS